MNIQEANGTAWPNTNRQEYFRLENPSLPGVVFLRDLDVGGNVLIQTAPEDVGGGPGTFVTLTTVAMPALALKMQTLATFPAGHVFLKIAPASKTEFALFSASPFNYDRDVVLP